MPGGRTHRRSRLVKYSVFRISNNAAETSGDARAELKPLAVAVRRYSHPSYRAVGLIVLALLSSRRRGRAVLLGETVQRR